MSIPEFKSSVREVVKEIGLVESAWESDRWKGLWNKVSQDVLDDAFGRHRLFQSLFADIGPVVPRKCKSLARVRKKMTEQLVGGKYYFKVVSDFIAGRIQCDVPKIPEKINGLREIVQKNHGVMFVRGSSATRPYGHSRQEDGTFLDIVQYVHVFIDAIGYPAELQIGHPFAFHAFTIDSAIRENPTCGKVKLWAKGFFQDVRIYLLNKANKKDPGAKKPLFKKAAELHGGKVPEDLQRILDAL